MKLVTMTTAALLCAGAASATTFTDSADFLAQGGTYTQHTDIGSDFTITSGPGANAFLSTGSFTTFFAPNPYVVISGEENFSAAVTFASEIFAFGMDIYEPTSTSSSNGCNVFQCVESTFEISFISGGTTLETITFAPDNNTLSFIGYSSDTAFDTVQVFETIGSNDNEMFGNFVTSATAFVAPVPLPAGLPLLVVGLGALGLMRRKRTA